MTAEADILQQRLLQAQNSDGGWGFQGKTSWTEPTAFALLALAVRDSASACARAVQWLQDSQRQDGGWSPQPRVAISTWVTSLAALSLLQQGWQGSNRVKAFTCLRGQVKQPEQLFTKILARALNQSVEFNPGFGTSWVPGTAAWLYPTAMAVLAFLQLERLTGDKSSGDLGRKGQEYILSRRCGDGGWNHGGSRFLSEAAVSYPEMTGLALLALGGVPAQELRKSIQCAQRFVAAPASGEGLSWLLMGLAKHNLTAELPNVEFPSRTPREVALRLLALHSSDPRNFLVSPH